MVLVPHLSIPSYRGFLWYICLQLDTSPFVLDRDTFIEKGVKMHKGASPSVGVCFSGAGWEGL